MTKRNTRSALLVSALAMFLCLTMFVGTTFAWFTDTVTSSGNKIVAGNLDVQLLMNTGNGYEDISDSDKPIFGKGSIAQDNNAETLWEPGKTQVAYLAIKNNGTLALKYSVALDVTNVSKDLYKVMQYTISPNAQYDTVTAWDSAAALSVVPGTQEVAESTKLEPGVTHYFALSIHMLETADNTYQNGEVDFDLTVLATQLDYEEDSFGTDYDKDADYDGEVSTAAALAAALENGGTYKVTDNIDITETITVPAGVEVTLDLNGNTVTGTQGRDADNNRIHVIVNNGILTINGGTVKSAGDDGGSAIYNNADSRLTVNDVVLYGAPQSDPVYEVGVTKPYPSYAINNYGDAVVNGATIKSYHGAIATGGDGTTIINDADIDVGLGQSTGITSYAIYSFDNAKVTVNDGTFAFTKQEIYVNGGNTFCELGTNPIIINGGNYIGTSFSTGAGREYVIMGGTFDADPSAYVALGYKVTESNGKYVVSVDLNNVCSANAFEDALAEGGNVNVTANIEVDDVVMIPEGKEVVLNLNGNTLSKSVDSGIVVRNYGKLTLTGNGTIDGTIGNYAIRTEAGSELTIGDGIVVDGGFGAVSCFGGKLTINGGDFSNEESNTTHYVVYATNNSTVVINGGTFTFADDQYAGANGSPILAATNGTTIEINGGTFDATGGSALCYNANNIVIKGGTFKNRATATYGGNIEGKVADGYAVTKNGNVWTVAAN